MKIRIVLALLVLPIVAFAQTTPPASDGSWHFVVAGDSRNCGDVVMPAIAEAAKNNNAKFYWHLGDWRAIITLDNGSCDMFDDAQMAWLRNVLARDAADASIRTVVIGAHAALPDSRSCGHSMGNFPNQQKTGREVYNLLLAMRDKSKKQVYVLASHSHFVMDNVYDSDYWRKNGGVLPGWIVGTSGAVRYRLPETATPGPNTRTDVYGYLLGTVSAN